MAALWLIYGDPWITKDFSKAPDGLRAEGGTGLRRSRAAALPARFDVASAPRRCGVERLSAWGSTGGAGGHEETARGRRRLAHSGNISATATSICCLNKNADLHGRDAAWSYFGLCRQRRGVSTLARAAGHGVFSDASNHASMIAGVRNSRAEKHIFATTAP
jgi:5-aminolevulinate synthase